MERKEFDLSVLRITLNPAFSIWPTNVSVGLQSYTKEDEEFTVSDIEELEKTITALQEGLKWLKEQNK